MDKYKKSDHCVLCGTEIYNGKRDGKFMCHSCNTVLKLELLALLKEKSSFASKIQDIGTTSVSSWGSSNKTLHIKVGTSIWNSAYVQIPTSKILEIRDLNNPNLLFEYMEAEIKVQYALYYNKYIVPLLQHFEKNAAYIQE